MFVFGGQDSNEQAAVDAVSQPTRPIYPRDEEGASGLTQIPQNWESRLTTCAACTGHSTSLRA